MGTQVYKPLINRPALKLIGYTTRKVRPRNMDRTHPHRKLPARDPKMDKIFKLKQIQVPPAALISMILQRPRLPRFWTNQWTA